MANPIGWCDETINPIVGCTRGCDYCYARQFAARNLRGCEECRTFTPHFHPEALSKLARWRKPRIVFMDSMGDWFDPAVDFRWAISSADAVAATHHLGIVLTKCRRRARDCFTAMDTIRRPNGPIPNLWLGVSVTYQQDADGRIPFLRDTPVAGRIVSYEPMLGPVDISLTGIDWLILGAMTGPKAKKHVPELDWAEAAIDAADDAGVPVFVKDNLVEHFPDLDRPEYRRRPEFLDGTWGFGEEKA